MGNRWRGVVGFLTISALGSTSDALAGEKSAPAQPAVIMRVRIDNQAGVAGSILKFAEARASEVFAGADVHIAWIDSTDAIRQHMPVPFTVLMMANGPAKRKADMEGLQDGALGQSAPLLGRVYIYVDRIVASVYLSRDTVTQLGDVLAHELGHLLLPPAHSSVGIMRASIDMTTRRVQTFMDAETRAIRKRLTDLPMSTDPNADRQSPDDAAGRDRSLADGREYTIRVCVYNHGGVQGSTLQFAEAHAQSVFASARVRLEWIDDKDAERCRIIGRYTIVIMPEAPTKLRASVEGMYDNVMGQSVPSAGRVYIYYDRIVAAVTASRDEITILGDVIAHELGHLLLPPGHSTDGIMRPNVDMTTRRIATFTEEEAETIRQKLAR